MIYVIVGASLGDEKFKCEKDINDKRLFVACEKGYCAIDKTIKVIIFLY